MNLQDYLSISPLMVLLIGGLVLILMESFCEVFTKKWAFPVTSIIIALAFAAFLYAPAVTHPLMSPFLVSDSFSRYFTAFFLITGFLSIWMSASYFLDKKETLGEYHFLVTASLAGLILIASSNDFITLFIGLEILSISLYVLVAYLKSNNRAHEAAIKYFLLGSLSTSLFLFGVALIYGAVGSTSFQGLLGKYQALPEPQSYLFLSGASLVTLGLFFKAAVLPFHLWAPDVYEGASSPVTAFLAVASKAGGFAGLARIFLLTLPGFDLRWNAAVEFLAIATIIFANVLAIRQRTFRRFFAYSGISHSGFLLIALAAGGPAAIPAMLFYLAIYAIATLGAFATLISLDTGSSDLRLDRFEGLFSKRPYLALGLSLCLLTLAGFPPLPGFFAKLALFLVAYNAGLIALIAVGLLMTVFSAYYYFRIIALMFKGSSTVLKGEPGTFSALAVTFVSFVFLIYLTIFPETIHWFGNILAHS